MTTLISSYPITPGSCQLHYDGVRFFTRSMDADGRLITVVMLPDTESAREHYELAEREGHVQASFPGVVR